MNGLDAIIFTAGVGENDSLMRTAICSNMEFFGLHLHTEKNAVRSTELREINEPNAVVKILVVPTNEELEIAEQCYYLLQKDQ